MRGVGENCVKYLKTGWNRKEGKGNKDLKQREGGGVGTPLRTMILEYFCNNLQVGFIE